MTQGQSCATGETDACPHHDGAEIAQHARPWTASEVLLLEVLDVAQRRGWEDFAVSLIHARARHHAQILKRWHQSPAVMGTRAATRGDPNQTDNDAGDRTPVKDRLGELIRAADTEVLQIGRETRDASPAVESSMRRAIEMLHRHAAHLKRLPENLREAIDQDLCQSHRHFVLTGSPQSEELSEQSPSPGAQIGGESEALHDHALSGLALSGGGVRSASFAMGAIQSLSRFGYLGVFDYVSAVSGGGWAAGWMAAWAYRHTTGIDGVQDELFKSRQADSAPMRWVRRHISYLAPRPGLTSGDSWALLAAYIANWLPTLTLASLATLSLMLLPHALSATSVYLLAGGTVPHLTAAVILCLLAIAFMSLLRRLMLYYREPGERERNSPQLKWIVMGLLLLTTVSFVITFPAMAHYLMDPTSVMGAVARDTPWMPLAAGWVVLMLISLVGAKVLASSWGQNLVEAIYKRSGASMVRSGTLERHCVDGSREWLAFFVSSALVTLFMVTLVLPLTAYSLEHPGFRIAFGPLIIVAGIVTAEMFSMMLFHRREIDRAWAARLGGWLMAPLVGWTVLATCSLGATLVLRKSDMKWIALSGAVSLTVLGLGSVWALVRRMPERRQVMSVAAALAVLVPLVPLAAGVLTRDVAGKQYDAATLWIYLFSAMLLLIVVAVACNVNRYSLHAVYKHGLVRTFLGASRFSLRNANIADYRDTPKEDLESHQFRARRAQPATDIDEADNPPLAWLVSRPGREMPVLLFNAAINGISLTDREGRAPRQWPFTFSQRYTGSPAAGIGYAATETYQPDSGDPGLTLGSAMAVSGAAVSPTAGVSTHPIRAFILGVLNARLGMWLGNPSAPEELRGRSPPLGGYTILKEMLGSRARFGNWVHLSDGGHFENLGIYELVRRGCSRIVAIDASCDPERDFGDLADAIRRARIDLGVEIFRHDPWNIRSPAAAAMASHRTKSASTSWMWFEINYGQGLPPGRLLYIKPSLYENQVLRPEILNYWKQEPAFPHESTINQFFTERQMEAYRSLGETCMRDALQAVSREDGDSFIGAGLRRSRGWDAGFLKIIARRVLGAGKVRSRA